MKSSIILVFHSRCKASVYFVCVSFFFLSFPPLAALDPLQTPLVPMGTTSSVAMGNTMYPSLTAQSTASNQTFNPFS